MRAYLTHSGEKAFNCAQCDYSTSQASKLRRHMRSHSGEKAFSCIQCIYSCSQISNLKTHMLTHSGEEPFQCDQCNFSCNRASSLKEHTRWFKHFGNHQLITIPFNWLYVLLLADTLDVDRSFGWVEFEGLRSCQTLIWLSLP